MGEDFKSAADELQRPSSGLDSLKDACRKLYEDATSAAGRIGAAGEEARDRLQAAGAGAWTHASRSAGELDRAVRVETPRWIAGWMPEEDKRQQIARVLQEAGMKAADVAIREAARSVPYGPEAYGLLKQVAVQLLRMEGGGGATPKFSQVDPALKRKVETLEAELLDLRARLSALSESLTESGLLPSPPPASPRVLQPAPLVPGAGIHGPADVIGAFLREGFKGGDFLRALIVPLPGGKSAGGSPAGSSGGV